MQASKPVPAGRILDLLSLAVKQFKVYGMRGIEWTFDSMTSAERIAFDLFLVRMKDSLAWEPGTTEHRFKARVVAMAMNIPAAQALAQEGSEE